MWTQLGSVRQIVPPNVHREVRLLLDGDPMSNPVHILATTYAQEGKGEEVARVIAAELETVRAKQGCLRYDLFREKRQPDVLVMQEVWATVDDLRAHGSSRQLADLGARLADSVARETVVTVLVPIDGI